jgi:hypothetical protein
MLGAAGPPTHGVETVKANQLRVGDWVKADCTSAWSTILSVHSSCDSAPVSAVLRWGWIIYNADEDVEVNRRESFDVRGLHEQPEGDPAP